MEVTYDLAVIGGGPAGCAAAITAARNGKRVVLFERGKYPRHKVCGEFVSHESHQLLNNLLGDSPILRNPASITRARMFADGHCIEFALPTAAWSISRFDLDAALWDAATSSGVVAHQQSQAEGVSRNSVRIAVTEFQAQTVINATGRWSNLKRPITPTGPRLIGLKAHFAGEDAPPSTDIYFFTGGYCGIQPVGPNLVNASAMVRADVATSLEHVFAAHPELWLRSRAWEQTTETVSTSPLVHAPPEPVTDGVFNIGDAAAFIDPFVGDGISLALRTGVLAAKCAPDSIRYEAEYHRRFGKAFRTASIVRKLVAAPEVVRRAAIFAFQSEMLRNYALRASRAI
ncbi:MAG TPA: FAD-dependent oxidoreductase [Terriglobales bacterium]|nr:FAD-dependent oxidoreductase [Terriglobales bacterium]